MDAKRETLLKAFVKLFEDPLAQFNGGIDYLDDGTVRGFMLVVQRRPNGPWKALAGDGPGIPQSDSSDVRQSAFYYSTRSEHPMNMASHNKSSKEDQNQIVLGSLMDDAFQILESFATSEVQDA